MDMQGLPETMAPEVLAEGERAAAGTLETVGRQLEHEDVKERRVRFESNMRASERRLLEAKSRLEDTQVSRVANK